MDEFTINEMKEMQLILQEKYKDKWEGISVPSRQEQAALDDWRNRRSHRHRKKAWGF